MSQWLAQSKAKAAPIEADVKDAKRRISAMKAPKKRRTAATTTAGDASDGADEVASEDS